MFHDQTQEATDLIVAQTDTIHDLLGERVESGRLNLSSVLQAVREIVEGDLHSYNLPTVREALRCLPIPGSDDELRIDSLRILKNYLSSSEGINIAFEEAIRSGAKIEGGIEILGDHFKSSSIVARRLDRVAETVDTLPNDQRTKLLLSLSLNENEISLSGPHFLERFLEIGVEALPPLLSEENNHPPRIQADLERLTGGISNKYREESIPILIDTLRQGKDNEKFNALGAMKFLNSSEMVANELLEYVEENTLCVDEMTPKELQVFIKALKTLSNISRALMELRPPHIEHTERSDEVLDILSTRGIEISLNALRALPSNELLPNASQSVENFLKYTLRDTPNTLGIEKVYEAFYQEEDEDIKETILEVLHHTLGESILGELNNNVPEAREKNRLLNKILPPLLFSEEIKNGSDQIKQIALHICIELNSHERETVALAKEIFTDTDEETLHYLSLLALSKKPSGIDDFCEALSTVLKTPDAYAFQIVGKALYHIAKDLRVERQSEFIPRINELRKQQNNETLSKKSLWALREIDPSLSFL